MEISPSDSPRVSFTNLAINFFSGSSTPLQSEQIPGRNSEESFITLSDFEFETAQHSMDQEEEPKQKQDGEDVPSLSFADKLFGNGQVMPLKPPPRLQYVQSNRYTNPSSAELVTSPKSVLKGGLFRSFRKNTETKDFDPFNTALEHIRKEDRGRDTSKSHRRARSLSPLRTDPQWSINFDELNQMEEECHSQPIQCVGMSFSGKKVSKREVRMGSRNDKSVTPTLPLPGNTVQPRAALRKSATKGGGSAKGSRRFSFRENLFRNKSEGSTVEEKQRSPTAGNRIPPALKSSSFRSMHKAHYDEKKELESGLRRQTFIPYKAPCMLVCLGFGKKGLRNLN